MVEHVDAVASASLVARRSDSWIESAAGALSVLAPRLTAAAAAAVSATPQELLDRWINSVSAPVRAAYARHLTSWCRWTLSDDKQEPSVALAMQLVLQLGCRDTHLCVRGWRDSLLAAGLATGTVSGAVTAVGSLVRALKDAGLVEWVLERCAPKVESKHDRRGPVRGEVERLLAHLDEHAEAGCLLAARDAALVALLHNAALRRQEALQLTLADVELHCEDPAVWTRRKGYRERKLVTIGQCAAERLLRWLRMRGDEPGAVFPRLRQATTKAKPMTGESCRRMLQTRAAEAGIRSKVRPHGLRHASATELLKRGSLIELQSLGGWRTLSAASHYIDMRASTRARAIELVEV